MAERNLRTLSFILVLLLCIAVFVACDDNESTEEIPTPEATEESSEQFDYEVVLGTEGLRYTMNPDKKS